MRHANMEVPSCCCGRLHCPVLGQNNSALEGLERDLRSAVQVGQVCFDCFVPVAICDVRREPSHGA